MYPSHAYLPALCPLTFLCDSPFPLKVHFVLSIYLPEFGQIPSGQLPKGGWIFLHLLWHQKPSAEEEKPCGPTLQSVPQCCGLVRASSSTMCRVSSSVPMALFQQLCGWGCHQGAGLPFLCHPLSLLKPVFILTIQYLQRSHRSFVISFICHFGFELVKICWKIS